MVLFEKCIRLSICQNISVCLSIHLSICGAKGKCSAWVSSWTQAQSACLPHSFRQHQILYYFVTDSMDCLKVSMYSSTATQSWLHVNVNSSLTSYLLHHHVTSFVCMSLVKISDKFIRPTTVFCGTDLLYQTQHDIQITAGSGSMNESLIDTVGYLCCIVGHITGLCVWWSSWRSQFKNICVQ